MVEKNKIRTKYNRDSHNKENKEKEVLRRENYFQGILYVTLTVNKKK